jgi:hypothetical protein
VKIALGRPGSHLPLAPRIRCIARSKSRIAPCGWPPACSCHVPSKQRPQWRRCAAGRRCRIHRRANCCLAYCRREGRAAVQQAAVVAALTIAKVVYSYWSCRRRTSAAVPQTAIVALAAAKVAMQQTAPATLAVQQAAGAEGGGTGGPGTPNKLLIYLIFISSCLLISHYLLICIH